MSKQHKYLVTTDADTGAVIRVEQLGTTGELVEVPAETLPGLQATARRDPAAEPRHSSANAAESGPGVFIEAGMREPEQAHPPGIFLENELRDPALEAKIPEARTDAPAFFGAELPETRADAPAFFGAELPETRADAHSKN